MALLIGLPVESRGPQMRGPGRLEEGPQEASWGLWVELRPDPRPGSRIGSRFRVEDRIAIDRLAGRAARAPRPCLVILQRLELRTFHRARLHPAGRVARAPRLDPPPAWKGSKGLDPRAASVWGRREIRPESLADLS